MFKNSGGGGGGMATDETTSTRMRASGRWALGSLVLVAHATSEISGLGTVAALPIAALTAFLSALCHGDLETYGLITKTPRRFREARTSGDLFEFLGVWFDLLGQLAAAATCARLVSATMDYMSGGRSSDWLFGFQSHSLGEPWPDILAISIVVVLNLMFMLGLENSYSFFIILNVGTVGSLIFFLVLGCMYADLDFWKHDSFLPEGIVGMFTTAAMCTFGFMDVFPEHVRRHRYRQPRSRTFLILLVQLLTYIGITMLFTLMSYFRELKGTAVPLVRMFEARDVDWARPIMASFTILVVAVALMEFCPAMCSLIVNLAGPDWKVLTQALGYENETTGSPVLAIFTAGSLAAILAFACPITFLVRLMNVGPLLQHILEATAVVYYRYQPEDDVEDFPVCTDVEYSRLSQGTSKGKGGRKDQHSGLRTRILNGSWFLPKSMRKSRSSILNDVTAERKVYKKTTGMGEEEREYLLMGAYSPEPQEATSSIRHSESNLDLESESDCSDGNDLTTMTVRSSDAGDESSTDIDAVVHEYKERLKVATTLTGPSVATVRLPSLATGRFVLGAIFGVCAWSAVLSIGVFFGKLGVIGGALSGALILTAMITAQPQVHLEHTFNQPVTCSLSDTFYSMDSCLIPIVPVTVIIINAILAAMLMPEIWFGVAIWLLAGMVLFLRCDECCLCWDCVDGPGAHHQHHHHHHHHGRGGGGGGRSRHNDLERVHLQPAPIARSSVVSTLVPSHRHLAQDGARRITHVDTILIAR